MSDAPSSATRSGSADLARKRLLAILSDVEPALAAEFWNVRDVRELPREIREAIW